VFASIHVIEWLKVQAFLCSGTGCFLTITSIN
jgi:hypothetical protein